MKKGVKSIRLIVLKFFLYIVPITVHISSHKTYDPTFVLFFRLEGLKLKIGKPSIKFAISLIPIFGVDCTKKDFPTDTNSNILYR